MRRNTVSTIWIGGLLVTAAIYAGGADEVLRVAVDAIVALHGFVAALLAHLAIRFGALMRALAIALYLVFAALGLVAVRRGARARRALILVTAMIFVLLVVPVWAGEGVSEARWTLAFAISAVASLVMTQRLREGPVEERRWPAR